MNTSATMKYLVVLAAAIACSSRQTAVSSAIDSNGDTSAGDVGAVCNATIGRTTPVAVCTSADPCRHPIPLVGRAPIAVPTRSPVCATARADHPSFDDGPPDAFTPADGVVRYACIFHPPGASAGAPRPLLIFIHGSGGSAQNVYDFTLLRAKAAAYDLDGDPSRPGFHLASVNARNLHWPSPNPQDGPKHDIFHRDLAVPSSNHDVANLDRLIDQLAANPAVDPSRIYISGWSNGGQFAQLYAIARHEASTPGGHRIAAAAVYSAADPFNDESDRPTPSCQLDPYPRSAVPILIESRACDIFACNDEQAVAFAARGAPVEPGAIVSAWLARLASEVGDPNARWLMIDGTGNLTSTCAAKERCTYMAALANHLRWPDGISHDGGRDHEPELLDFLRAHPL